MRLFRNRKGCTYLGFFVSLALFVIFIPATIAPQEEAGTVFTNYGIIERISIEAIDELLNNMKPVPKSKLVVLKKDRSIGDIDFVFENLLLKQMNDTGWRVSQGRSRTADTLGVIGDYEFTYQLIKLNFTYPKISRRYWFGEKRVERASEIGIFAQLIDLSTGDILWVGDVHKSYGDVIPYGMLDQVEDEQYEFTKPVRNELRWRRLLEPIVVTGIVTGLVYLFFSNQSND